HLEAANFKIQIAPGDADIYIVNAVQGQKGGYLEPWRADPDCPLAQHLQHLFSNLEEIYEFNRSFLEDLRIANCEATKMANCFLHHDSGFSVYNEYCTNYPRTMEVLGELTRDENKALLFREKQIALGHALPLGSYLLKPVQRILKYHLLLQRLSKQCEPVHKPAVDLALTTMTGIASDINNMKRKHEHAVRVQEIQSQLYGWNGPDLTALGELIAEGTFRVVGSKCSNLMLVEQVRGEPLSFHVLPFDNPRLQCTLKARSPQHKREWTLQIKRVILENYSAVIPNHARQLVLQLGQDLNDGEDTNDKWSPLKQYSTPHYLERRSRVRKTRDFTNRRASSQDRSFPSLGSWRRKSEPNMIPQYNSKTMPKKITKIKKAKECSSAKFYMDLSDSETCDVVDESMESLSQNAEEGTCEQNEEQPNEDTVKNNLEKIVSEILMQNQHFHRAFCRQMSRRNVTSDPTSVWYEDRLKLPSKADSLPRSFQLNDQIELNEENRIDSVSERLMPDMSLKENPDINIEEQHKKDLSSQLDDSEHPEHKIYRKSAIRFSILQRIRHIMSEEQKRNQKYPLHKQGSKSMGEKIANPDYVDPQKLFLGSRNCSQINLSAYSLDKYDIDCDIMGEPELLDLTINEKEVLTEIERRLNDKDSLTEEYVKDSNGKLVAKQDSFTNSESKVVYMKKFRNVERHSYFISKTENSNPKSVTTETKPVIKRPTKAPPPIPTKPSRLMLNSISSDNLKNNSTERNEEVLNANNASCNRTFMRHTSSTSESLNQRSINNSTSWVKTMVGRFE
ncbi:hypothetical protein NQ314_003466, partial [Rhamnusium bicolor]